MIMLNHPVQQGTDPSERTRTLSTGLGNCLLGRYQTFIYWKVKEETWAGAGAALGDTRGAQGNSSLQLVQKHLYV